MIGQRTKPWTIDMLMWMYELLMIILNDLPDYIDENYGSGGQTNPEEFGCGNSAPGLRIDLANGLFVQERFAAYAINFLVGRRWDANHASGSDYSVNFGNDTTGMYRVSEPTFTVPILTESSCT